MIKDSFILVDISYFVSVIFLLTFFLDEQKKIEPQVIKEIVEIKEKFNDDVILEDEMYKQGRLVKSWKKRKFVLYPFRLCYYDGKQLKGTFNIKDSKITDLQNDKFGFMFTVQSPSDVLKLVAETIEIRDKWIEGIKSLVSNYNENIKIVKIRVPETPVMNEPTVTKPKMGRRGAFFSALSLRKANIESADLTNNSLSTEIAAVDDSPKVAAVSIKPAFSTAPKVATVSLKAAFSDKINPETINISTDSMKSPDDKNVSKAPSSPAASEKTRWSDFLQEGESIIMEGTVIKKNPMGIPFNRQLILTSKPRLFYLDPQTSTFKGEIEWPRDCPVTVEEANKTTLKVSCKGRSYKFIDSKNGAQFWVDKLNSVVSKYS